MLNEEALLLGEKLSVATVYNTLDEFAEAGLIRRISKVDILIHLVPASGRGNDLDKF